MRHSTVNRVLGDTVGATAPIGSSRSSEVVRVNAGRGHDQGRRRKPELVFCWLFDLSKKPDIVVSCIPMTPARTSPPSSPT